MYSLKSTLINIIIKITINASMAARLHDLNAIDAYLYIKPLRTQQHKNVLPTNVNLCSRKYITDNCYHVTLCITKKCCENFCLI